MRSTCKIHHARHLPSPSLACAYGSGLPTGLALQSVLHSNPSCILVCRPHMCTMWCTCHVHNLVHMCTIVDCRLDCAHVHNVVQLFELDRKAAKSDEFWAHVLGSHARLSQAAILGESVSLTLQHTLQQQAAILGESASLTGPEARAHGNRAEEVYEEALDIVNQQLGLEHPRSLVLKVPLSLLKLTLQLEKHTHCILIHTPSRPLALSPSRPLALSPTRPLALSPRIAASCCSVCFSRCLSRFVMWPTICPASCCELPVAANTDAQLCVCVMADCAGSAVSQSTAL